MKLISSKKTKQRIALMFLFALMLSNLLSLIGPSAQAAITLTPPPTGTCFQHVGTVTNGALVTVYNIGTIQLTLTVGEINNPGQDGAATAGANTAAVESAATRATLAGSISADGDVIGNVFSFVPPVGTNFVIVPGFEDTTSGQSNRLAIANATISNAFSQDSTNGAADSALGINVGVITAGTAGIGRAIVAIARDADSSTGLTQGVETYPKSGTSSNTATITIVGLGIAIPPSGNGALSGTLQATLDATPPSGIGASGGVPLGAVATAISGLSGTLNLCTVTPAAGQVEAVLDTDDDATELYDKSGTSSANLLALGSISSNTRVWTSDTATLAAGVSGTSLVDVEAILIRGTAGTGLATRDQVIATGKLLNSITSAGQAPNGTPIVTTTNFSNSNSAPITVAFAADNTSATTTLLAVDIIISSSTPGATPAQAGFAATQTPRSGFLGALRAATYDSGATTTNNLYQVTGAAWGVASVGGGSAAAATNLVIQETQTAGGLALGALAQTTGNATEPFNNTFIDLRLECGSSTNPVAGWFALLNSSAATTAFGTTSGLNQIIGTSQAGHSFVVNSTTTLFTQALTNIGGSNPITGASLGFSPWTAANAISQTTGNALLYASCTNNTLTLVPIQNGFDATKDIIAITPKLQVTNISSTFTSDVNLIAQVSGNNLSTTTTLNLAKLVGACPAGTICTGTLAAAQGVGLASNAELAVTCSSGGESNVVLSGIFAGTLDSAVTAQCTSGAIAPPTTLFTGGVGNSVSGSTVIDGSAVVQGEGRGILIKESTPSGFNELVSQIGGGTQGTIFEVQLPTGCDVIDDRDDNNTAVSTTASTGGNDGTRTTITSTTGVTAAVTLGGAGDAALTNVNAVEPATGATPAKLRFRLAAVGGAVDNATTDAILLRIDSQDVFCPSTTPTGDLMGGVFAQNKASGPTVTSNLGTVSFGTAKSAATFAFGDDVATSTKGEVSTNTMTGITPRLAGGLASTAHTFTITEGDARGIPIGGRVSSMNLDPDNGVLSNVIVRGQIWVVPSSSSAFSAAPVAADISFSDNSLVLDGSPLLVTSATVNANAPIGTILIGVKKNTAAGAADPATSTTTITVKNAQLTAALSSTTDLTASVEFFSQDGGVIVNTPGIAAGNSASTPTTFTPFSAGSTKAFTQLNGTTAAAAAVQLGSGTLANQLLTSRLTSEGTPQITTFAKVLAAGSLKNADASKITAGATALSSSGSPATDNQVTVTGSAGTVDGGAQVVVTTGSSSTYDSTTVTASDDGSFAAKLRGDCTVAGASITVNVTEQVSGTKTTTVTKTAVCGGSGPGKSVDDIVKDIVGADGKATIAKVLSYVSSNGGLAAIVSAGGNVLQAVIKAAKSALGLS